MRHGLAGADPAGRNSLVRLVLACLGVIGVMLSFRTPPMAGFDEPFHWRRALQVAAGHPLATRLGPNDWGGRLDGRALAYEDRFDQSIAAGRPLDLAALHDLSRSLATTPSGLTMSSFPSTASFSPVAYLPAAIGIGAARLFHLGPLPQIQAGRLAGLATFLLLVWCIARLLPAGGLAAAALLTVPTALHLAASLSADPLCNALPALLVAACLRLRHAPERRAPRHWQAALLLLLLLVGLLKPIACILSAVVLLVPRERFANAASAWRYRAAGIALCLAAAGFWNLAHPFVPGRYWHTGADPRAALQALRAAPLAALANLGWNAWSSGWVWWVDGWGRFGGGPGPYHFTIPTALPTAFLVPLLALAASDRDRRPADPRAAGLLLLLAALYVAALLLAFRIGFGPPRSLTIEGVQGRYLLLPFLLLLLALAYAAPSRIGLPRAAAPLLLGCLALDLGAAVVALGHFAAVWH